MSFIDQTRSQYCKKAACQRALGQAVAERKKTIKQAQHNHLSALHQTNQDDLSTLTSKQTIPITLLDAIQQQQTITALVPDNNNQLTELPESRKQAFLTHLAGLFNDLKTNILSHHKVYAEALEPPLSLIESNLLGYACATCRGYCCTWGGTHHAFQDYPSLQQYLKTQAADITEQQLINVYAEYIPTHSYQNACVFQGELGCTLPSEMRSFTCNNYRCSSLTNYQQALAKSNSNLTYAAAVDGEKISRATIFDSQSFVLLE